MINERRHINDNGFVSHYWYDADGERTVKTSGEGEQVYVNSLFSGGTTQTKKFTLYVSPYLVASQGGKYTKHIYVGSQRIVSKLGGLQSYGADPRRIPYASSESDNITVDYKGKYQKQQQVIKDNYATFEVPYNGLDNDNYVDGDGFCCDDKSKTRSFDPTQNDNYERAQFYYHPDHLGSSSFITNLDGDVAQHIEYVPFGEVFIEERNNVWNTPYLFNAKELDEETGLYYYGARYYNPRISVWLSTDPLQEKYPDISSYCYTVNNPIKYIDPDGLEWEPTKDANTGKQTGYKWVPKEQAYNKDGSLKKGLYHQAIFFSHNGTFDENSDYNMGSSTAYVYKADGTTTSFEASTYPARTDKYATVPEGIYEAKVGKHKGSYDALRMSDVGTDNFYNNKIELGTVNPAFKDGRTYSTGINIHKGGLGNLTGLTSSKSPVSAGCSLIPISSWKSFIGIFNTAEQRNNVVSVTMSRTFSAPSNRNIPKRQTFSFAKPYIIPMDNTRVVLPMINRFKLK